MLIVPHMERRVARSMAYRPNSPFITSIGWNELVYPNDTPAVCPVGTLGGLGTEI